MPNPAMSPAVQAALQRRMPPQGDQGQLDQTSPDARMANPSPQPTNPSDATRAITPPAAPQPKFEPQNRKDLITMALIEQLKSDNKLEQQGGQVPPAPTPQSQPMPAMGGGYPMGGAKKDPREMNPQKYDPMVSRFVNMSKYADNPLAMKQVSYVQGLMPEGTLGQRAMRQYQSMTPEERKMMQMHIYRQPTPQAEAERAGGGGMPYPQNTAMAYGGGYNNSYGGSMSTMDKQSNPWKQDQERFWK